MHGTRQLFVKCVLGPFKIVSSKVLTLAWIAYNHDSVLPNMGELASKKAFLSWKENLGLDPISHISAYICYPKSGQINFWPVYY